MTYASEHIAAALVDARKRKGLSQRELSKRSGVPQSHISKIESNIVDLRLSSLASLAYALDLELTLIPRKAAPAVRSISRSAVAQNNRSNADALQELVRAQRALGALPVVLNESGAAENLQKLLLEMNNFRNLLQESDAVRQIRIALESIKDSGGMAQLQEIAKEAQRIRNMLAHSISPVEGEPARSKPAYRLDEEDSDG